MVVSLHVCFTHGSLGGQRPLLTAPTPVASSKPRRDRAVPFQAMLDTGQVADRAELARALGCSMAWVTRVLGTDVAGAG